MGHFFGKIITKLVLALALLGAASVDLSSFHEHGITLKQANAQYFVRKKTDEEKAAEKETTPEETQTEKRRNNLLIVDPKRAGSEAKIEKRRLNPLYITKQPKKRAAGEDDNEEGDGTVEATVTAKPSFSLSEIKTTLAESFGQCSEEDKRLKSMVDAAFSTAAEQSSKYAEAIGQDAEVRAMAEMDFEALRKQFEETGEFPPELQKIMTKTPKNVTKVMEVLRDNVDMEEYVMAVMRCTDMAAILENPEFKDHIEITE